VNVRVYVAVGTTRPESKAPSSAVTVCVRTLSFVHVTVSPRSTSRCWGFTASKPMLTGIAAPSLPLSPGACCERAGVAVAASAAATTTGTRARRRITG